MWEKHSCCCEGGARRAKPPECSPEQIRACHGEVGQHPCEAPDHPCQQGECAQGTKPAPQKQG